MTIHLCDRWLASVLFLVSFHKTKRNHLPVAIKRQYLVVPGTGTFQSQSNDSTSWYQVPVPVLVKGPNIEMDHTDEDMARTGRNS